MRESVASSGHRASRRLLLRAILVFLALPALVGFAIPIWLGSSTDRAVGHLVPALALLGPGTLLLFWCVRELYVAGRGTLAPWDPPRQLVTTGPYRISRNPMYIGVVMILAGTIGFHLRVLLYEEPWAGRRFGSEWDAYRARGPRWVV